MSRYSKEELRDIAKDALKAKDLNDMRFYMLLAILSEVTGVPQDECIKRIEEFANEAN